jgi:hypothetical protein
MSASCLCELCQNPDSFDPCASLWLEVGTSPEVPYAEIVFCSLMNVVLGYDPIGYGLPYGKLVGGDTAFSLMEVSVQALVVLLDFGHPLAPSPLSGTTPVAGGGGESITYVSGEDEHAPGFNVFRKLLRDIGDPAQLNFIFRGFSRLLNNVHRAQTTFLPHSATKISIDQELMVLLWKCLEEIPAFVPFILKENLCDVNELVVPVCFFLLEGRKDPAKLGMLYLCTFVLLKLSGERSFSVALNKPYKAQLPVDMPLFKGSHADLVVVVLHKLMVGGMDKLSSLYTCFLTIICNISPYCKTLCASAAHKLVNLLELFTSPKVLFAAESNYTSVVMLLESLNNLVQYQYEGNFNLVFSVLTRRKVFEWLNSFTVSPSLLEQGAAASGSKQQPPRQHRQERGGDKEGGASEEREEEEEDTAQEPVAISSVLTPVISATGEKRAFDDPGDESKKPVASAEESTGPESIAGGSISSDISSSIDEKAGHTVPEEQEKGEEQEEEQEEGETVVVSAVVSTPPPPPPLPPQVQQADPQQQQQEGGGAGGGFTPTPEWVARVKRELPLHTLMRLLRYLVPLVEELAAAGKRMDELGVLGFVRRTTMVGILPVPHPIVIRKYQPNQFTSLWFTAFMWGVIFLHNQAPPKLFDGRGVRLFMVQGGAAAKQAGSSNAG